MSLAKASGLHCFIVADDLTGACDAAVHFAEKGMTAEVAIAQQEMSLASAQVVAVNTDSRCVTEELSRHRVQAAFQAMVGVPCGFFFKKIDSSLRGNVFSEVSAAAQAIESELIFVAPALPALNRRVIEGKACLPSGERIDVATALHPLPVAHVPARELACTRTLLARLQEFEDGGVKTICFDAESDCDLDGIVVLGIASGRRMLWVGSAGLAGAIARKIARPSAAVADELHGSEGPVLFGVGSNHDASLAQAARLRADTSLLECSAESVSMEAVREAIGSGRNVLLHLPQCGTGTREVAAFAEAIPIMSFGGIVLTGGDTASAFLRALGTHTLQMKAEAMPGIPMATICGGMADGMKVITKSGAFGEADTFVRCVEYLQSVTTVSAKGSR